MEKPNGTVFKAKITPDEVRAKIEEDKVKVAAKLGEKVVESKKPKREKPENSGDTGDETQDKKAKPKAKKEKEAKKPKIATFPKESFVNKYHFMRVGPDVLMALGWQITGKRLAVELDLKDGALIVRKPSK
jgi:hypothetical protein